MPRLCELEKLDHTEKEALANTDRVLTLVNHRIGQGVDIYIIRGEDCSGLAVYYLLKVGILKSDTTANGLYEKTKHHPVPIKDVKAGDYLFEGNNDRKWHVGYAISNTVAVESQNHDVGVVQTVIANRKWKYATRPDWYDDSPSPEPSKPVLTRELFLTNPYMRGEDVEDAQQLLTDKGYNPGSIDGIFGKKTEIATKNFQSDYGLTADGIIGKKTARALGFEWEGD